MAALLDVNSDPAFSVDSAYRYTSFNSAHAAVIKALYGVQVKVGMNLLEAMSVPADRQVAKSNLDRALRGECFQEDAYSGEFEKSRRHFTVKHDPMRGSDGKINGVLVIARDTTDLHDAEVKSQIAQDRLTRLAESNVVGVVVAGADGIVLEANDYYLKLIGSTREELVEGKLNWKSFTPAEHLPADARAIEELVSSGVCQPYEKEYVRYDGTRVWVELEDAYLGGVSQLIVAIVRDVSRRKAADRALIESEAKHRLLLENAGLAIVYYDLYGTVVYMNERASLWLGSCRENFLGKRCTEVYGDTMGQQVLSQIRLALDTNETIKSEYETEFRSVKRWLQTVHSPIFDSVGQAIGVQVIADDITDAKLNEIERQQLAEQIEKDKLALEQKHAALVELLDLMKNERETIAQQIEANIDTIIDPLLVRLKAKAGKSMQGAVSTLEQAIRDVTSPFVHQLSREFSELTPRELEVCDLVRKGKSSKEIAEVLDISLLTVHKLRQHVRNKLHLIDVETDLATFLRSLKPSTTSS
jgi:PAS domain S-box-containing protein